MLKIILIVESDFFLNVDFNDLVQSAFVMPLGPVNYLELVARSPFCQAFTVWPLEENTPRVQA